MDENNEINDLNELMGAMPPLEVSSQGFAPLLVVEYLAITRSLTYAEEAITLLEAENLDLLNATDAKKMIVRLSFLGTVAGFRALEELKDKLPQDLLSFAEMALVFGRLRLENELLGEHKGILITGLGGDENHLRYYVALFPETSTSFTDDQSRLAVGTFESVALEMDSKIETSEANGQFILLLVFGSMDYAISDLIKNAIEEMPFIRKNYFVTNVEKPTEERLNYFSSLTTDEFETLNDLDEDNLLPAELRDTIQRLGVTLDFGDESDIEFIDFSEDDLEKFTAVSAFDEFDDDDDDEEEFEDGELFDEEEGDDDDDDDLDEDDIDDVEEEEDSDDEERLALQQKKSNRSSLATDDMQTSVEAKDKLVKGDNFMEEEDDDDNITWLVKGNVYDGFEDDQEEEFDEDFEEEEDFDADEDELEDLDALLPDHYPDPENLPPGDSRH